MELILSFHLHVCFGDWTQLIWHAQQALNQLIHLLSDPPFLFLPTPNSILRASSSQPHPIPMTSKEPSFQIPQHWGLGIRLGQWGQQAHFSPQHWGLSGVLRVLIEFNYIFSREKNINLVLLPILLLNENLPCFPHMEYESFTNPGENCIRFLFTVFTKGRRGQTGHASAQAVIER